MAASAAAAPRASRLTWRLALLMFFFAACASALIGRLVYIQILHHQQYWLEAQDEHLDKRLVHARRGAILDRNGFPLATSLDVFDLYIDRRAWHDDPDAASNVASKLAPL